MVLWSMMGTKMNRWSDWEIIPHGDRFAEENIVFLKREQECRLWSIGPGKYDRPCLVRCFVSWIYFHRWQHWSDMCRIIPIRTVKILLTRFCEYLIQAEMN